MLLEYRSCKMKMTSVANLEDSSSDDCNIGSSSSVVVCCSTTTTTMGM